MAEGSGALYFGTGANPVFDSSRYYSGPALSLADADWSLVWVGIRLPTMSVADPAATAASSLYAWSTFTSGSGTGGNDCFLRFYSANNATTANRRKAEIRLRKTSTELLSPAAGLVSTTQFVREKTYTFALVRSGTTVYFYSCENGGSAVSEASGTLNGSWGAKTLAAMYLGVGSWAGTIQGMAHITKAISTSELEAIAAGGDVATSVGGSGNVSWQTELNATDATISPILGSGNLTRVGTWTNRPIASPSLPLTGQAITCDDEPAPYQPIGLALNGTTASLAISGTYAGFTPATFQARVLNFADATEALTWTNLSSFSAVAGAWSGTLAGIPAGGPYYIQVRDSSDTSKTWRGTYPFIVGPVVALTGQSPFAHLQANEKNNVTLTAQAYGIVPVEGTSNADWELWPYATASISRGLANAANTFADEAGLPIFFAPTAIAGSSSEQWADDTGSQWTQFKDAINTARISGTMLTYWNNGASDAGVYNATEIKANHDEIYAQLAIDFPSISHVYCMVPYNRDTNNTAASVEGVRKAQREWAEDHADFGTSVFIGWPWIDMQTDAENTGTAQSGTSTTITLAANDPNPLNNTYSSVTITGGTGSGQTKTVTAFNASSNVATISGTFSPVPDNTSVYRITGNSPHPGTVGLTRAGIRFGLDVAHRMGAYAYKPEGPTVASAHYVGDGTVLYVLFDHVGGANIRTTDDGVSSTSVIGFDVSEDAFSTTETISTVEIVSARAVKITLSGAPSNAANLVVRYLYGYPVASIDYLTLGDIIYDDSGYGADGGLPAWPTLDNVAAQEYVALSLTAPTDTATVSNPIEFSWEGGVPAYTLKIFNLAGDPMIAAYSYAGLDATDATGYTIADTLPAGEYEWSVTDATGATSERFGFTVSDATGARLRGRGRDRSRASIA